VDHELLSRKGERVDDAEERAALRSVCLELPELLAERKQLPAEGQALVDRVRAEATARRPVLALLAELVGNSQAETVRSLSAGLSGVGPGRPDEERFVCPDDACDREDRPEPGDPVARCALLDRPMKRA
jgi:hypothetical protein